jgi:hypothetical protein
VYLQAREVLRLREFVRLALTFGRESEMEGRDWQQEANVTSGSQECRRYLRGPVEEELRVRFCTPANHAKKKSRLGHFKEKTDGNEASTKLHQREPGMTRKTIYMTDINIPEVCRGVGHGRDILPWACMYRIGVRGHLNMTFQKNRKKWTV